MPILYNNDPKEKLKSVKCKGFKIPIYPGELRVGWINKGDDFLPPETYGKVYVYEDLCLYVLMRKGGDLSHIAHESQHILEQVQEYIGDKLTGEASAYLIQWIFKTIHSCMINSKQKQRGKSGL